MGFLKELKIKLLMNLLLIATPQDFQGFVPFQNQEDGLLSYKKRNCCQNIFHFSFITI